MATGRSSARAEVPLPKAGSVATDKLPPKLRILIRAVGESAAYRLADTYGGVPLWIPKKVLPTHNEHPINILIGPVAFMALVEHFGSEELLMPKVDSLLRQVRHERVRELAREAAVYGHTLSWVARRTNYSLRQVHNILVNGDHDDRQGDLFGESAAEMEDAPIPVCAHDPFQLTPAQSCPESAMP